MVVRDEYAQVTGQVGQQLEPEGWTEWRYAGEGDLDGQVASVEAFTKQEGANESDLERRPSRSGMPVPDMRPSV